MMRLMNVRGCVNGTFSLLPHSLSPTAEKSFGMITVANRHLPFIWDNNKTLLLKRFATAISEVMIRERNHFAMEELQEELIAANEKLKNTSRDR